MARGRQIIALGGGGFSMEASPALDDYILEATDTRNPRVCFLATASGDAEGYIARFYRAFRGRECQPTHVELFRRKGIDLETSLLGQDVIYVGGGNTANMLAIWRLHGVDQLLERAYRAGTVLAGVSAGAVCWFQGGTTDSFGSGLSGLDNGLGLLRGSMCPHYDGEINRRPRFHELVQSAALPGGYAADDSAALHFCDEALKSVVCSRQSARAYTVERGESGVLESLLPSEYIGTGAAEDPSVAARKQALSHVALVVRDYDEAIEFFTSTLRFSLVEDSYQPEQNKRWVVVAPPNSFGATLLLAKAVTAEQQATIGKQTGGRVFLFLDTDDFWRDYKEMVARGVVFVREPKEEPYGTVAVFKDLYGNLWDLVQRPVSNAAPA